MSTEDAVLTEETKGMQDATDATVNFGFQLCSKASFVSCR